MKFNQLKIDQPFLYKGNRYTKSGLLQAIPEGRTDPRIIMRAAQVEPLESPTPTRLPTSDANPHKTEVIQALDRYHEMALSLIREDDPTEAENQKKRLNDRYQHLLEKLN